MNELYEDKAADVHNSGAKAHAKVNVGAKSRLDATAEMAGVVFVGAGPHSLTCVLRLLEPNPMASIWVDPNFKPNQHPTRLSRKKVRSALQTRRRSKREMKSKLRRVFVLDASSAHAARVVGDDENKEKETNKKKTKKTKMWMRRWDDHFDNLHIPYLRSPVDVHPDPVDPQCLEMDAERKKLRVVPTAEADAAAMEAKSSGTQPQLVQVQIDGLPRSHQDFHGPRLVPSTTHFKQFCAGLTKTYGVDERVQPGRVCDIVPRVDPGGKRYFDVLHTTPDGEHRCKRARAVVVAIGHCNCPRIPEWAADCQSARIEHVWQTVCGERARALKDVARERRGQTVIIVGGGLTSAYAAEAFIAEGVRVVHLVRRTLLAKPFDIDMKWAGKRRAAVIRLFQRLDPQDRAAYNQSIRERGSLTHTALAKLRHMQETCSDYSLLEETSITEVYETANSTLEVFLESGDSLHADWICLCTGSALDVNQDPLLQKVQEHLPTESFNGLPTLDSSLRWHPEWDLFVMGAYAGLQLGPDALNLAGARRGALRVVPHLHKHLSEEHVCTRDCMPPPSA